MVLRDDERHERRELQRRRARRHRLTALGALAAAALAVVAGALVVAGSGDSGGGSASTPRDERTTPAEKGKKAKPADPRSAARLRQARAAGPVASKEVVHREPVAILMYHVIDQAPPGAALPALYVPRADFSGQMRELRRRGYEGVTLDQVYQRWHGGPALPEKPVVVSFDDGHPSWSRDALPVLDELGWPGVANVQVDLLGSEQLSKGDVRKLIAAGWEIDSHTFSHADVATLAPEALEREVAGSRRALRERLGVAVNFFCYPAGKRNEAAIEALRRAGYRGATTTEEGAAAPDPAFELRRIRVNAGVGASALADRVDAATGG